MGEKLKQFKWLKEKKKPVGKKDFSSVGEKCRLEFGNSKFGKNPRFLQVGNCLTLRKPAEQNCLYK
jgi:hypothetical protein